MMKRIIWLVCIGVLSVSGGLFAEENVVYTCEEPPLNFTEQANKRYAQGEAVTGFTTDVVRKIIARTNLPATIRLVPWARAYRYALNKQNVFIYSMARTSKREELFKWVGPIARKKTVLFANKGSGLTISSLDDAKMVKSIGTMRQDAKEQYLKQHGFTNLESSTQWEQGLKKLLANRITLWTNTDLDAPVHAKRAGFDIDKIERVYTMYKTDLYIGVSKTTSDHLVGLWQHALEEIKQDGTFQRLVTKWAAYYRAINWTVEDGMLQIK